MCDLCSYFKKDEPFNFHRPYSKTSEVLVGKTANKYIEEFEKKIYPHAMNNSLMTAIIGQPGAGKTQLIHYIEGCSQKEKDRVSLILELKDVRVDHSYLINYICNNKYLNLYLHDYGYDLPRDKISKELIPIVNKSIEKIRIETKNHNVGICLLVDAVDEYIRKVKSTTALERGAVISDLLGTFMFLLNDFSHLCVVFAITNDVYLEFKEVLKEASPGRRFLFISDENGDPLTLERLDEEETQMMVSRFLNIWSKRNAPLPILPNTTTNKGLNIYPFTRDAINLFWRAGAIPGDTCMACIMALKNKIISPHNPEKLDHIIVTKSDAAWIIRKFSGYFVNYEKESSLKREIESLLEGDQINYELDKIAMKARQANSSYSDAIIEAFESYTIALSDKFKMQLGNRRKFFRYRHLIGNEYEIIDLVINFQSENIGIQFISNESGVLRTKIKALSDAMKNKQIKNGILVLLSEKEKKDLIEKAKNEIERQKSNFEYHDYFNKHRIIDYSPAISLTTLDGSDAWYILGLHDFIHGDKIKMEKYSKHFDKKVQIYDLFDKLVKKEPGVSYKPFGSKQYKPPTTE